MCSDCVRLGGIYFILARSDSSAVAPNSLTQNKIYTPSPVTSVKYRFFYKGRLIL